MKQKEILLIQFVIDNSSSMKGEKIEILTQSILRFDKKISGSKDVIKYSIVVCDKFSSVVIKNFDDETFESSSLIAHGLPFIDSAYNLALSNLFKASAEFEKDSKLYKPWLISALDGQCEDDCLASASKLQARLTESHLSYFPFMTCDIVPCENLSGLFEIKRPLVIVDKKYDDFAYWVATTAKNRVDTPIEQGMSLSAADFNGWIKK